MPNPSEEARKQHEELEHHRNCVRNVGLSKKSREYHLGQIRHLCNQLGEEQPGNYNE